MYEDVDKVLRFVVEILIFTGICLGGITILAWLFNFAFGS